VSSPFRAALRAANAEVHKTDHAAAANRKGTERARDLVRESNSAAERATVAAEKANERTMADAERALLAGKPITVGTTPDKTQAKEKAAIAQVALARVAHASLEGRQRELDGAAAYAREKRERAIDAVIKQEFPLRWFLVETQEMHDQYASRRVILWKLLFGKLVEGEDKRAVDAIMRAPLPPHPDQGSPIDWNATPAALAWDAMRQALADDADAPIEIGL
jgi:hypothetical protein